MSKEENHDDIAQDMFGVFEQEAKDVNLDQGNEGGSVMFNPNAKDAEEQTWRGVIKFLPNLNSGEMKNHTIKKISYWIPEKDGRGFRWDSPKSVGERCIVNDKYWDLKNSKNAKLQKKADQINYQPRTFALIQIIKDLQDEDNNGKIKVWALPMAVEKQINEQMYPSKKDIDMGAQQNNVFNPLTGYPMILKIGVKNVERDGKTNQYRDYDSCKFKDKPMGIILDGEDSPVDIDKAKKDDEIKKSILNTIKQGANLQDYAYSEPTEKEETRVKNALEELVTGKTVKKEEPETDNSEDAVDEALEEDSKESDENKSKEEKSEDNDSKGDGEKEKPKKENPKKETKKKPKKKSNKPKEEPKEEKSEEDKMMEDLGMDEEDI